VPASERAALVAFFESTGGPEWTHKVGWLGPPGTECNWHGVDCASKYSEPTVTGGLYGTRWKVESSVFNGREPDEERTDFDFAAMDSWSGRVWFLPTSHWALQLSAGRLNEVEPGHDGDPPVDIDRVTASVTYHRTTLDNLIWANTLGWGHNAERGGDATNAVLVETSVTVRARDAWYGRFEWGE